MPAVVHEKRLNTKAKDNHGNEYPVILRMRDQKWRWLLIFEGAPSGWYVSDLLMRHNAEQLAIDFGQDWNCTNIHEILKEAAQLI